MCIRDSPRLNLVTAIGYRKGANGESAGRHEYDYDALGRPIQRRDSWDVATPSLPHIEDLGIPLHSIHYSLALSILSLLSISHKNHS